MQTDYWNVRGIDLRNKGKYDDAIEAYNKAIRIDQFFSPAWSNKGTAFGIQGNDEEAIKAHNRAIDLNQQAAMVLNNKVYALFNRRNNYEDIKALNRRSAKAWTNKGATLSAQGAMLHDQGDTLRSREKYIESIDASNNALGHDFECVGAHTNKGSSFAALGNDDKAIEAHENATRIKPLSPKVWNNKGQALARQKKYIESIETFDMGIEALNKTKKLAEGDENEHKLNILAAVIWFNKGCSLRGLGKIDEAIEAYDRAIEMNPLYSDAWNNKGTIFHDQGKYIRAIQAYDRALKISPRNDTVLTNKGWALYFIGKCDRALECFERSIDINQKYALTWYYRGIVLLPRDKYKALQDFEKATKLDQNNAAACYYKGMVLLQIIERNPQFRTSWDNSALALKFLYHSKEVYAAFDKAIEIDPRYAEAHYGKGIAFYVYGEYDKAIKAFDKAIKISPQCGKAYYCKARSLRKLGRMTEANATLAKAKEYQSLQLSGWRITDSRSRSRTTWTCSISQKWSTQKYHIFRILL